MPKLGMQAIRTRQVIEATIDVIHQDGINQASLRRIGEVAGISPSLVTHYFGNREQLFVAVLKVLNKRIAEQTAQGLARARTPVERLAAIAAAQFDEEQFRPNMVSAWFALWGKLPEIPELQAYQRIYERRLTSNIRHALRQLVPAGELEFTVNSALAMIDGLWVKAAQPTSPIDRPTAYAMFLRHVHMLVNGANSGERPR